ncbi:energy transducer TonB [Altererythrobacter sp. MF3-039]|uniref:energy transducer TonB n=1 Tax=Altererythrobacter sp. MF3-039 TaxID=3252901 RepID=UPI00390C9F75
MALASLRKEDKAGLAAAVVLHLALAGVLVFQPEAPPPPIPERMTVNLAEDVGFDAMSPTPVRESRASTSPDPSDELTATPPQPDVIERPVAERPAPNAAQRPREDTRRASRRETPTERTSASGTRRFEQAFSGAGSSTNTQETRVPASQIGASAKASLVQALARQIKPHWQPPSGPDVDQITTFLRFRLNEDGTLAGKPTIVRQTGVTATNRAQSGRHGEQAIRAVQLAAPFDLPDEYYEAWKLVGPFGFDWKLAQ